MSRTKSVLFWVLAFVLMALIATYQRVTGPTYPVSSTVTFQGEEINTKLPRSHDGSAKDLIKVKVTNQNIIGYVKYRRYKSHDDWTVEQMRRDGNYLYGSLPEQPPAGKVMYQVYLIDLAGDNVQLTKEPVILRFKGVVPPYILIPHIISMFLAMVFSMRAGIEALAKGNKTYVYSVWAMNLLIVGGLILGPLVQYFAFGAFWTGWPFGHDLTDNKTLLAFIGWLVAVIQLKKHPERRHWAIIASIVLLAVYLIPHSVLGSEIDYTKMPK